MDPDHLQRILNSISLQDVVIEDSGQTPETKTQQKNSNITHTCKVQVSEHSEKAASFNADLSKLLLDDA